jgi:hypothetical protein
MVKYIFLITCMMIFLFPFLVSAANYCIDNTTLISNTTIQGQEIIITENCTSGCSDTFNLCMPSNFIILLIILAGFVILVGIIKFIRR